MCVDPPLRSPALLWAVCCEHPLVDISMNCPLCLPCLNTAAFFIQALTLYKWHLNRTPWVQVDPLNHSLLLCK